MKNASDLFKDLNDYKSYFDSHSLSEIPHLNFDIKDLNFDKNIIEDQYKTVDKDNKVALPPELDDLLRLHFLVTSRKVTTILEFGVGHSTAVFDHALSINREKHEAYCLKHLRRENLFECFSVDSSKEWIDHTKINGDFPNIKFHYSPCTMGTFESKVCTYYDNLPNVTPDLIYIDAPDQYNIVGEIRGISTRSESRLPMSADILSIEHFLHPGTLIIIDGRTGNSRFLKANFQKDWTHYYSTEYDQHFFELKEEPLGPYDKKRLEFCLGKDWLIG